MNSNDSIDGIEVATQTPRQHFQTLHDSYQADVWKYVVRRTTSREHAEEVVNDTFLIAWKNLETMPGGLEAKPWLFAVARNQLRNNWRKTQRYTRLTERLKTTAEPAPGGDPADLAPSANDEVIQALSQLRSGDAEILKLVAWDGLNNTEVAAMLDCSLNTVASRIHRARERFGKELNKIQNETPQKCNSPIREDLYSMKDTNQQQGDAS